MQPYSLFEVFGVNSGLLTNAGLIDPLVDVDTQLFIDPILLQKSARAYSPDLNPIEMAFSKLKAHLRAIGARTFDALWRAIGSVCDLFTPQECWNYLVVAGYAYK